MNAYSITMKGKIYIMSVKLNQPEVTPDYLHDFKRYNSFYNKYIKRIFDFILAMLFLVILLPVFLFISVLIISETGFPVFYRAERGGLNNKNFKIFKFRTMIQNADKIGGGTTALNDSRITKIGSFLRKTKLDEIPQLLNILNGTMSFIGPRPELVRYTEQYTGTQKLILAVRPGITDYSSMEYINLDEIVGSENADDVYEREVLPQKNKLREKYAHDVSFTVDIKIFFMTVFLTLRKAFGIIFKKEKKNGKNNSEKLRS